MRRGSLLWHRKQIALRKLFALALCLSFTLSPVEMAFAQDAGTDTAPTEGGSTSDTSTPEPPHSVDFSIPGVDSSQPSPDGSTESRIAYNYNPFGRLATHTTSTKTSPTSPTRSDAIGNLSTSTIDANNLYVATTTNPLFQTTGYSYDYSTGKVKTFFDVNGRLYTNSYDGLGRPLTASILDATSTSITIGELHPVLLTPA
jgi:hypothetical protein